MGVDRDYQAIPAGSEWVNRAREDWKQRVRGACIAEGLVFLHGTLVRTMRSREYGRDEEHHRFVLELIDADPTLAARYFDSNRYYDALHFVLSEYRRVGLVHMHSGYPQRLDPDDPDAIFDLAMLGDEVLFGENVWDGQLRDLQGSSARYLRPEQVEAIARALTSQSETDVQSHCSHAEMVRAGVYKPMGDWSVLQPYFEQLRAFYAAVANAGEGVIVSTT